MRALLASGRLADARERIARQLADRPPAASRCRDWAEVCEEAGLPELARSLYERAVEADPTDRDSLLRLVEVCEERGGGDRAIALLEEACTRQPDDAEILGRLVAALHGRGRHGRLEEVLERAREHGLPEEGLATLRRAAGEADPFEEGRQHSAMPDEADLVRFLDLFAGREDLHARQWYEPSRGTGYSPVHQPLSVHLLRNHLLGNVTLGVYPLRRDGRVGFFALDIDIDRAELEARRADGEALVALRNALVSETKRWMGLLGDLGFEPLVEDSGYKGRHLWVFLGQPVDAVLVHRLGRGLLGRHGSGAPAHLHAEFFPKQGRLRRDGVGNLIKLPLGVHRKTGRRSVLLDAYGAPVAEPWERLRAVRAAAPATVAAAVDRLGDPPPPPPAARDDPEPEADVHGPAPAPPGPTWTDGHFETDPEVAHLLGCCPVLAALRDKVRAESVLSYDEQTVLRHTLGHLPQGVHAVNHLFAGCTGVPEERRLKSRLGGMPSSCARIRRRLPELTWRVGCACDLPPAPGSYPHPLLHLETLRAGDVAAARAREAASPERLARHHAALRRHGTRLESDRARIEAELVQMLEAIPGRELVFDGGRYRLVDRDGLTALEWEPAATRGKEAKVGTGAASDDASNDASDDASAEA